MKISLNWLKKYVDIPNTVSNDELVRLIGARLVEVEGVIDESHKYDNIYIVRVESCKKIPDTHLTLCKINVGDASAEQDVLGSRRVTASEGVPRPQLCEDGGGEAGRTRRAPEGLAEHTIQVVCGAPNVQEGMLAVWIAPGAIVPASVHEDAPFVIGKRKMRGYESNGMLAGADELDFGDDHSGIVEIDPKMAQPGDLLADVFELDDIILDIENKSLTHRPDCFGIIGFAREVAGILGQKFSLARVAENTFSKDNFWLEALKPMLLTDPTGSLRKGGSAGTPVYNAEERAASPGKGASDRPRALQIKISSPDICPRYSALILEKHGELKNKYLSIVDVLLSKSGMKPISPIVDATNYFMLLTGQPLHAFDYDKFLKVGKSERPEVIVRLAKPGEKLILLDDKEVTLTENDIIICSGKVPVALAGAMGGKSTMIDENTRNIILESATFSLYNLRKTQMAHGIFSEAITRFTKGQPAYQTLAVAECCAKMLREGFKVTGGGDQYPKPAQDIVVKITTEEINSLLGTNYDNELIVKTLENVGFNLTQKGNNLEVTAPVWRTDIQIKEDIIEEVGRLLGYDNIVPTLPLHATADKNKQWELKKQIRRTLARFGANEVLTYSFVSSKLMEKAGQDTRDAYKITNSISPELQYIRQSIVPSLLEKAYVNEKLPVEEFAIFEMNKVYRKNWGLDSEKVPLERMQLGFVIAERKSKGTAFYKAKWYAAKLLEELRISPEFLPMKRSGASATVFEPQRSAEIWVGDKCIGGVGEIKNSVRHEFKLAPFVAAFELDINELLDCPKQKSDIDFGIKKREDVTVTTNHTYAEELKKLQEKYPKASITPGGIYQAKGQKTKNITFHISK